ncbi:protein kinase domain-containing protein [Rickettsiella endosymbiont of Dermanyssus gallinae]|uniref:protein kinase domain-containing protein n=1 Tax=Rickettsiella endosymbiont of Dermanyssus gallinae TaxID=2856608 RepID=UPI001C52CDDB|nr:protein kinase [Rickettsiella endosymbiont of Dermanyssus gallinae]
MYANKKRCKLKLKFDLENEDFFKKPPTKNLKPLKENLANATPCKQNEIDAQRIKSYTTSFTKTFAPGAYANVNYHNLVSPGGKSSLQIVIKEGGEHVSQEIKIFELIASNKESPKKAIIQPRCHEEGRVNLIYLPPMPGENLKEQKTYIYNKLKDPDNDVTLVWFHKQIVALLEALNHLHTQNFIDICHEYKGIVHGDIKLANLLINDKGDVILADLGSAYPLAEPAPKESGNLSYTAPEISGNENFRKKPIKNIEKSDIWSLGIVLYLLLNDEYPSFTQKYLRGPASFPADWCSDYSASPLAKQAQEANTRLNSTNLFFNNSKPAFTLKTLHDVSLVMLLPINERPSAAQLLNTVRGLIPPHCSEASYKEFVSALLTQPLLKDILPDPSSSYGS